MKLNRAELSWAELCVFIVCVRFTGTLFAFRCFLTYIMLYTFSCDSVTQLFKIIITFFLCVRLFPSLTLPLLLASASIVIYAGISLLICSLVAWLCSIGFGAFGRVMNGDQICIYCCWGCFHSFSVMWIYMEVVRGSFSPSNPRAFAIHSGTYMYLYFTKCSCSSPNAFSSVHSMLYNVSLKSFACVIRVAYMKLI